MRRAITFDDVVAEPVRAAKKKKKKRKPKAPRYRMTQIEQLEQLIDASRFEQQHQVYQPTYHAGMAISGDLEVTGTLSPNWNVSISYGPNTSWADWHHAYERWITR